MIIESPWPTGRVIIILWNSNSITAGKMLRFMSSAWYAVTVDNELRASWDATHAPGNTAVSNSITVKNRASLYNFNS